ncbi:MAG: MMPL family transporter [Deltaproteobacteria bacterium]|nr:MAG: MMPL family transporter [Deltaproteobacteria bacterium]
MARHEAGRLGRILARWMEVVGSTAVWTLALAVLITAIAFFYTLNNLSIRTDTGKMLSERLPFRRSWRACKKAFPQQVKTMLVVVDATTPDLAEDASTVLATHLKQRTDLFKTVYLPGGDKFFQEHALLYLSPDELEDLADNLARVQPFLSKLARDQSLRGLFNLLARATEAVRKGEDLDLAPMFDGVGQATRAILNQSHYQLSWHELMLGGVEGPLKRRRIIMAQPRRDIDELLPAAKAMGEVRRLANQLGLNGSQGVRVRLTGEVALECEELLSVSRGATIAGILALIMVGMVLFLGLGSPRLVFATLATLLTGLIWAAGFATVAVGHLNLISVAFAVLYIGLSVDYAIHFCLRYRELIQLGHAHKGALRGAGQDVGSSLVLCAVSTAIGFYAFLPTAFIGVSELGLIAGTGMFISLVANLTVLPALLTLMPLSRKAIPDNRLVQRLGTRLLGLPLHHVGAVRVGAIVLGLAGLSLLPQVRFDYNPLNLRDPDTESVSTFTELLEDSRFSPWSITVISEDRETVRDQVLRLREVDLVERSLTVHSFVPQQQEEKLKIISEIGLILSPQFLESGQRSPPGIEEQVAALRGLLEELERFLEQRRGDLLTDSAERLYRDLKQFQAGLQNQERASESLANLEASMIGSLPARLNTLRSKLAAESVTMDDLPEDLEARWVTKDGRYRIEVFPRENVNDNDALDRFVAAVRTVAPDATGPAVISLEAGRAIVKAFQQALLSALVAITVLLLILLKRKSDTLLVLLPLVLAGVFTGAASVVLNIPFNFANVIALPLLLGIGVDSGIHMVHRFRTDPPESGNILWTSTARAVLFSTLTTFCSFGNLAFSSHRGVASMGLLLTIGMGFTLLCTLVVLPALLAPSPRSRLS